MKRIGIFAGTFDPVHNGHLAFAEAAAAEGDLDKVFFLVEPTPRRKQGVKAFQHRVKMVQLAIKDNPTFGSIVTEQQQFSVAQTLPHLVDRFKDAQLVMLMGEDWLSHLTSWPHVGDLAGMVDLLVGVRKLTIAEARDLLKNLEKTRGMQFRYQIIENPSQAASSSKVRALYRKGGVSPDVPLEVTNYIKRYKLYNSSI